MRMNCVARSLCTDRVRISDATARVYLFVNFTYLIQPDNGRTFVQKPCYMAQHGSTVGHTQCNAYGNAYTHSCVNVRCRAASHDVARFRNATHPVRKKLHEFLLPLF